VKSEDAENPMESYINAWRDTHKYIIEERKNPAFDKAFNICERLTGISVTKALQLPIERMAKYKACLYDLQQNTDDDHEDYMHLDEANKKIKALVNSDAMKEILTEYKLHSKEIKKAGAVQETVESSAMRGKQEEVDAARLAWKHGMIRIGLQELDDCIKMMMRDGMRPLYRRWRENQIKYELRDESKNLALRLKFANQYASSMLIFARWHTMSMIRCLAHWSQQAYQDRSKKVHRRYPTSIPNLYPPQSYFEFEGYADCNLHPRARQKDETRGYGSRNVRPHADTKHKAYRQFPIPKKICKCRHCHKILA